MENPKNLFDLSGQVAIITGASAGLGVTFAKGLASAGAKVVLAARRHQRLKDLVTELETAGYEALAVSCDVTNAEDVDNMVSASMDRFGRIDILVNNAGIGNVVPAEDESPEDFRQVMDINVTGMFICSQRCGRVMLEANHGSIINIASIMGLVGVGVIPGASYHASKAAVINLTREMATQWARRGVRVNAIAPGWFPSEMTEAMFADEKSQNFIRRHTPMSRPGKPEELIGSLLLLASNASSYMTGQTLVVDGGWTII